MATKQPDGTYIIAAGEVAAYTVCPMAWKLKWIDKERGKGQDDHAKLGQLLHRDWSSVLDESLVFGKWIRYLAVLLCTAVVVFLLIRPASNPLGLLGRAAASNIFELLLIVGAALIVIRAFGRAAVSKKGDAGLGKNAVTVSVDGSASLEAREYISPKQGLAGMPDALIVEDDAVVPVERKPLAKKLRDRYVAQLLVYMRLVEEFEGSKPPFGYLLLGPNCRRVRIDNTEAKQAWLQKYIDQMRGVLAGGEPRPDPHPMKCSKCDVRHRCSARADSGRDEGIQIGRVPA